MKNFLILLIVIPVISLEFTSCEKVYEETNIYTGSSQVFTSIVPASNGETKDLEIVCYRVDAKGKSKNDTITYINKGWKPDLGKMDSIWTLVHCGFDQADSISITSENQKIITRGYCFVEKRLLKIYFNLDGFHTGISLENVDLGDVDQTIIINYSPKCGSS